MPKKNKQQQEMEQQLQSFVGSTAGSILIAVGLGVAAFPYAVKYLVKNAEEQALPYAAMLGSSIGDRIAAHAKATAEALKKKKADQWHEANPDVTQQDLDIPGGIHEYFQKVGLPASSHLVVRGDMEAISVFQHSGEWNYYGIRIVNTQAYYLIVPKGINVFIKVPRTLTEAPDEYGLCRAGWTINEGVCEKDIIETFLVPPAPSWP